MYKPALHAVFPQTAPQRKLTPNLRDKASYVFEDLYRLQHPLIVVGQA